MQMNAQKKTSLHAAFISSPMNSAFFPYMGNILGMFGASAILQHYYRAPASSHRHSYRQTYGADGETIIRDCCQTVIFGGFSPCPIPPLPAASCLEIRRSLPVPFQPTTGKAAAFLVVDQIAAAAST
ncbi:MAG: hypothetical protein ACLSF4_03100 [Hominenteromicrobium sp.]|uniref:hypothetical protein n=1 Tax=Hominenteromicrobium sp. TaxID=3073581 RepID=UPI003992022E